MLQQYITLAAKLSSHCLAAVRPAGQAHPASDELLEVCVWVNLTGLQSHDSVGHTCDPCPELVKSDVVSQVVGTRSSRVS